MNTLKMFLAMLTITALSILVGCSDQITSSGDSSKMNVGNATGTVDNLLPVPKDFVTEIRLKPRQSYKFDVSNTEFTRINAIDVQNLSIDPNEDHYVVDCQDILVYGNPSQDGFIKCHSRGFDFTEIIVQNQSSKFLNLKISLAGIKQKAPDRNSN